jgi:hypothetical protein
MAAGSMVVGDAINGKKSNPATTFANLANPVVSNDSFIFVAPLP